MQSEYDVGICDSTFSMIGERSCEDWCPDTELCSTYLSPNVATCIPFSLGVMFEKYSTDPSIVHYGDFSSWTGDAIPNPQTCPSIDGFQACGGNCGGCTTGAVCSGRSPLHPVGVCFTPLDKYCWTQQPGNGFPPTQGCSAGESCFIFTVDAPAQTIANQNGGCMATAKCQTLAAQLPGGGSCVNP